MGAGCTVIAGLVALAWAGAAAATPPPIMSPAAAPPPPAPNAVVVRGLGGQTVTLSLADIAGLPHEHVTLAHMGKTSDYAGPLLSDILRQVDAPLGVRMHGPAVADVVVLTASDNYVVALSLGEIDPDTHKGARVILADQEDGKPLPPNEAPIRLVIDGDAKPARDVHSLARIELKHLP